MTDVDPVVKALAENLETLRRTGLWRFRDWWKVQELLSTLNLPTDSVVPSDVICEHLRAASERIKDEHLRSRVRILLGIQPGLRGKSPTDLLEAVKSAFGETTYSVNTKQAFRRRNYRARCELAEVLLAIQKNRPNISLGPIPYVSRTEEQAAVNVWIESNTRLAVLAGDSGNGKSRLAYEVARKFAQATGTLFIAIDASTQYSLFRSIKDHVESEAANLSDVVLSMVSYLAGLPKSAIVIVDNVSDWDSIEEIVLAAPRCLITAEQNLIPPDHVHQVIQVGPLGHHESLDIIHWFRPDAPEADAIRFASLVGRKPRIIIDCLGMFAADEMTLQEMSECIEDEASRLVETAGKSSRAVHKLYERYFHRLEREDQDSARYMAILVHLGQPTLEPSVAGEILSAIRQGGAYPVAAACRHRLRDRYLLSDHRGLIEMHGITQRLFRPVTASYASSVYRHSIERYLAVRKMEKFVLTNDSLDWIPGLARVLASMPTAELRQIEPKSVTSCLYDARYGLMQLGMFGASLTLIARILSEPSEVKTRVVDIGVLFQWMTDLYEHGILTRGSYASFLKLMLAHEVDHTRGNGLTASCHLATVQWRFAEMLQIVERISELVISRDESVTRTEWYTSIYARGTALAWLGYTEAAVAHFAELAAPEAIQVSLNGRFMAAMAACINSAKVANLKGSTKWLGVLNECYQQVAEITSRLNEAIYLSAAAWHARLRDIQAGNPPREAISLFLKSGMCYLSAGMKRRAVEIFPEAVALREWMRLNGHSDVPEAEDAHLARQMHELAVHLEEFQTVARMELIAVLVQSFDTGFTEANFHRVLKIAETSAWDREDARTYKQAIAAAILFAETLRHTAQTWALGSALFEVIMQAFPTLTPDYFRYWISTLVNQRPIDILLL